MKECKDSRDQVRKDVKNADSLKSISDYHSKMKEAFVRFDDGRPFFRDLKIMEIVEDMEILKGIDKQINTDKIKLPPVFRKMLKIKNR